jgi:hypothetical protein
LPSFFSAFEQPSFGFHPGRRRADLLDLFIPLDDDPEVGIEASTNARRDALMIGMGKRC